MVVCLLIGNILLAAIASSNPMYQDAGTGKDIEVKILELHRGDK